MKLGSITLNFTDVKEAQPDDDRQVVCLIKVPNDDEVSLAMASWIWHGDTQKWLFHSHMHTPTALHPFYEVLAWAEMDFSNLNLPENA